MARGSTEGPSLPEEEYQGELANTVAHGHQYRCPCGVLVSCELVTALEQKAGVNVPAMLVNMMPEAPNDGVLSEALNGHPDPRVGHMVKWLRVGDADHERAREETERLARNSRAPVLEVPYQYNYGSPRELSRHLASELAGLGSD